MTENQATIEGKYGQKSVREQEPAAGRAWFVTADGNWKKVPAPWGDGDPIKWLSANKGRIVFRSVGRYGSETPRLVIQTVAGRNPWDADAIFAAEVVGESVRANAVPTVLLLEGFPAVVHVVRAAAPHFRRPWDLADLRCHAGGDD